MTEITGQNSQSDDKPAGVCGLPCEVYSRVCGYLRPVGAWNKGAKANYEKRRTFVVDMTPVEIDASIVRRFGHF